MKVKISIYYLSKVGVKSMKLAESKEIVQTNGHVKSIEFGIRKEDTGKILEFLRAKMYEDPIGAICREVACNARDANREAGKPNKPITIAIRDSWIFADSETVIMFTDEGPGISPSRMEDVFCNYGSSTKTNSNKQTGGFGLGAKTPFSYTDTFFVETNVDKIKYIYSAALNSAGTGEMILLSEIETEDPNGTSIIIPIKSQDKLTFQDRVLHATTFWKIQPNLVGFTRSKSKLQEVEINPLYRIYTDGSYHSDLKNLIILIDDIQYPVPINQYSNLGLNSLNLGSRIICLPFANGELSISANRETLFFDDVTINKLKTKVSKVSEKLLEELEKELQSKETLIEAHRFILVALKNNQIYRFFGIQPIKIESLSWKGNKFKDLSVINTAFQYRTMMVVKDYSSDFGNFSIRSCPYKWGNKQTIDIVERILNTGSDNIRLIVKDTKSKATRNHTIYKDKFDDIFIEPVDLSKVKNISQKKEYLKQVKLATTLLKEYGIDVINYSSIKPTALPKKQVNSINFNGNVVTAIPVEVPKSATLHILEFDKHRDRLFEKTVYFQRRSKKLFLDNMLTYELTEGIYYTAPTNGLADFRDHSPNWMMRNFGSENQLLVARSLEVLKRLKVDVPVYIIKDSSSDIFGNHSGMIELKQIWKSKEFIKTYSALLYNTILNSWSNDWSNDNIKRVFKDSKPVILLNRFKNHTKDKHSFSTQHNCEYLKDRLTVIPTKSKMIYDRLKELQSNVDHNLILSSLVHSYKDHNLPEFSSKQIQEKVLEISKNLFII